MRFASEISKILYFFRRLRYNESEKIREVSPSGASYGMERTGDKTAIGFYSGG